MAKIIEMKKYRKRKKIDRILLYCIDNKMETRYITAEFKNKVLLIRFTHFYRCATKIVMDYIYEFLPKEANKFVKLIAEDKVDFLYELQKMFNTATACQDIIQYADNYGINYRLIPDLNYDDGKEFLRYNFSDIYEDEPLLYYKNGSLIIPTLYKHPKNGKVKIYLPSGYLYMEISYKNNRKDGMTKCYFRNSKQIKWQQNYSKDKLNGISKKYSIGGKLLHEETFVKGVKEGWENSYNAENGYLEIQEMFANNKKNGKSIQYYHNGQIEHEAYFINGKQDGSSKQYYETGELKQTNTFKKGKSVGIGISYYKNGQIFGKTPWKNSKEDGIAYFYYETGELEWIVPYKNGNEEGNVIQYYKNGEIEQIVPYHKGYKHGEHKTFHYNGKLRGISHYKKGKPHGLRQRFYCNGQLSYEHNFKNGLRDGYSISYKEKTGEIQYKIFFRKGKVIDFNGNDGITGVKNLDKKEA